MRAFLADFLATVLPQDLDLDRLHKAISLAARQIKSSDLDSEASREILGIPVRILFVLRGLRFVDVWARAVSPVA